MAASAERADSQAPARAHVHFVTGRLAEHSLRKTLAELGPQVGFDYSLSVLNITVAALMTVEWVARRLQVPPAATRVLLPGYCLGDLAVLEQQCGRSVQRGPTDLRDLPAYFGQRPATGDYGAYRIEILAEINHAPRLTLAQILAQAKVLQASGADLIDIGCDPGEAWSGVGECVRMLRGEGFRISIDSFNPAEIAPAVRAGAELVLSVNSSNRSAAGDWGCEVVAIPDVPSGMQGLAATVEFLADAGVPLRIDPVLEPIGFGFAESLGRYLEARRRWPDAELLMGIGNLSELTDVDSAGVNVLLLGFCEELGIRSVLTTQVINWARSSVRECDLARRLVHYAVQHHVLPKHVEPRLVTLRDPRVREYGAELIARLAAEIRDHNVRLFAEQNELHLATAGAHLYGTDPFVLFERLLQLRPGKIDASHAFYLGYEFCKAVTALTLGKNYQQDEALDWGFLTRPESQHRGGRAATDGAGQGGAAPEGEP